MKLLIEQEQFNRLINKIVESSNNRSLLAMRKVGVSSSASKNTVLNSPNRVSDNENERIGLEMKDLEKQYYEEDNSDPQM